MTARMTTKASKDMLAKHSFGYRSAEVRKPGSPISVLDAVPDEAQHLGRLERIGCSSALTTPKTRGGC
jgi:hypothetical protein